MWKQLRRPSADERMRKVRCTSQGDPPQSQRDETVPVTAAGMGLEGTAGKTGQNENTGSTRSHDLHAKSAKRNKRINNPE